MKKWIIVGMSQHLSSKIQSGGTDCFVTEVQLFCFVVTVHEQVESGTGKESND